MLGLHKRNLPTEKLGVGRNLTRTTILRKSTLAHKSRAHSIPPLWYTWLADEAGTTLKPVGQLPVGRLQILFQRLFHFRELLATVCSPRKGRPKRHAQTEVRGSTKTDHRRHRRLGAFRGDHWATAVRGLKPKRSKPDQRVLVNVPRRCFSKKMNIHDLFGLVFKRNTKRKPTSLGNLYLGLSQS